MLKGDMILSCMSCSEFILHICKFHSEVWADILFLLILLFVYQILGYQDDVRGIITRL